MKALIEALSNESVLDGRAVLGPRDRNEPCPGRDLASTLAAGAQEGPAPSVTLRFPFKRSFPPLSLRHFKTGASYLE
ncbi:MAG: hypothetical protein HY722_14945 [Planctomycetes bacterium]|nr:hypothetical protein [Planctomycetota bacterium]